MFNLLFVHKVFPVANLAELIFIQSSLVRILQEQISKQTYAKATN